MRNQVEQARRAGLNAITFTSSTSDEARQANMTAVGEGEVDAILITPERIADRSFIEEVLEPIVKTVGLLVVDEAHCISDWGHDFRPDYRRIHEIAKRLGPGAPVLATTATATDRVIADTGAESGRPPFCADPRPVTRSRWTSSGCPRGRRGWNGWPAMSRSCRGPGSSTR